MNPTGQNPATAATGLSTYDAEPVSGWMLFGIVLIVVGLLVGPGGVSIFT